MPTIIFLVLAYQLQSNKYRYLFLILSAINLLFNIYNGQVIEEFYSFVIIALLFMINPYFLIWWNNRNSRNNPTSILYFIKEIYLVTKYNKLTVFCWLAFLVVSILGICSYTGYTGEALLGSLMIVFIILYVLRHLIQSMLPPEWFLHDINTRYVFLSVFIAWVASHAVFRKLGVNFVTPMYFCLLFSVAGFYWVRKSTRYLVPGCALILADIVWQIIRVKNENLSFTSEIVITELVLIIAMIIGLIWLIKKPGIFPIFYLTLFQLFRFSGFTYQAMTNLIQENLSPIEVNYYLLYLVCWMYIVPLLFWFVGFLHQYKDTEQDVKNRPDRLGKLLKKMANNQQAS